MEFERILERNYCHDRRHLVAQLVNRHCVLFVCYESTSGSASQGHQDQRQVVEDYSIHHSPPHLPRRRDTKTSKNVQMQGVLHSIRFFKYKMI